MHKGVSIGTCRMPTQYLSSSNRDTKFKLILLVEYLHNIEVI